MLAPTGHHRVHDGLRHHRHRARHRAHQVQEARRRGLPQDRQPDRPGGPAQARLHARRRSRRSSPTSTSARPSRARPSLKPEHLPVFDCAFKPVNGERSIHYMGHIRMMARGPAVPVGRHQQDRQHARERPRPRRSRRSTSRAGSMGLKAIAIYRDGSKRSQPLVHRQEEGRGRGRGHGDRRGPAPAARVAQVEATSRTGAASRPSAPPSPTSSRSPATRATSPSASTRTASRARSSSRWPRKAPRSAA